jgi:hypothetical protein
LEITPLKSYLALLDVGHGRFIAHLRGAELILGVCRVFAQGSFEVNQRSIVILKILGLAARTILRTRTGFWAAGHERSHDQQE